MTTTLTVTAEQIFAVNTIDAEAAIDRLMVDWIKHEKQLKFEIVFQIGRAHV